MIRCIGLYVSLPFMFRRYGKGMGTPSSRFEGCGRRTHIQRVAVDKSMPPLLTVHKYVNYWDLMLLEIPLVFLTD